MAEKQDKNRMMDTLSSILSKKVTDALKSAESQNRSLVFDVKRDDIAVEDSDHRSNMGATKSSRFGIRMRSIDSIIKKKGAKNQLMD